LGAGSNIMETVEESPDDPTNCLRHSEIISVTFAKYYFVIVGMANIDSGLQRRWQLRSSSLIGWTRSEQNADCFEVFRDSHERSADLISLIGEEVLSAALAEKQLTLVFSSGIELLLARDVQTEMVGDLESYLIDDSMKEELEGLWAL
jgi:hypothetical protein